MNARKKENFKKKFEMLILKWIKNHYSYRKDVYLKREQINGVYKPQIKICAMLNSRKTTYNFDFGHQRNWNFFLCCFYIYFWIFRTKSFKLYFSYKKYHVVWPIYTSIIFVTYIEQAENDWLNNKRIDSGLTKKEKL